MPNKFPNLPCKEIEIKCHTDFSNHDLEKLIRKQLRIGHFTFEIVRQSLDARHKPNVYWLLQLRVFSKEIKGTPFKREPSLQIPFQKRNKKVVVVGSGPAGFFAAYTLQIAGFKVILIEKGRQVNERYGDIQDFENGGDFKNNSNYCHGEGGAGTFSDGKLTSRTKGIAPERQWVFENYVKAGAPEEILYLAKPHIGSDNLRTVIPTLRRHFENLGGEIWFETEVTGLELFMNRCQGIISTKGSYECDYVLVAPGHSSYQTYRMLHRHGIRFRTKPFAIGVRVEHPQELINASQWAATSLPGLKAAEYKLTCTASNGLPVYSFCMCPGGKIVPSAPENQQNIVNGVSDYARNSGFANSAIVAGTDLQNIFKREVTFEEALQWMENLERKVFDLSGSYDVPGNVINAFILKKTSQHIPSNSYPFRVFPYDFDDLFSQETLLALREGMTNFSHKIKGFETGIMLGLESKTSSPVQVIRDEHRRCEGFDNIFIIGEGSGYAGGITSSAVDGVKAAMEIQGI
jgi:uncharacterized FAD-dependent dehydrogenase